MAGRPMESADRPGVGKSARRFLSEPRADGGELGAESPRRVHRQLVWSRWERRRLAPLVERLTVVAIAVTRDRERPSRKTYPHVLSFRHAPTVVVALLAIVSMRARPSAPATAVERWEASDDAMGTTFSLVLYGPDRAKLRAAGNAAFEEAHRVDRLLSNYLPE